MVDTAGDLLLGFSASKAAEYIGAFFYGGGWSAGSPRVHTGRIQLINAGQSYVHQFSWGHYTFTTFDSTDATYWTIQQYADHVPAVVAQPDLRWGTVIAKIKKM